MVAARTLDPGISLYPDQRPAAVLGLARRCFQIAALRAAPPVPRSLHALVQLRAMLRDRGGPGGAYQVPEHEQKRNPSQQVDQQPTPPKCQDLTTPQL
jgi:hypothetical protein